MRYSGTKFALAISNGFYYGKAIGPYIEQNLKLRSIQRSNREKVERGNCGTGRRFEAVWIACRVRLHTFLGITRSQPEFTIARVIKGIARANLSREARRPHPHAQQRGPPRCENAPLCDDAIE